MSNFRNNGNHEEIHNPSKQKSATSLRSPAFNGSVEFQILQMSDYYEDNISPGTQLIVM